MGNDFKTISTKVHYLYVLAVCGSSARLYNEFRKINFKKEKRYFGSEGKSAMGTTLAMNEVRAISKLSTGKISLHESQLLLVEFGIFE